MLLTYHVHSWLGRQRQQATACRLEDADLKTHSTLEAITRRGVRGVSEGAARLGVAVGNAHSSSSLLRRSSLTCEQRICLRYGGCCRGRRDGIS